MIQIRNGVFETNSSSTHSITICSQDDFDKWKKGELLFDNWNDCFAESITLSKHDKEQAKEYYNNIKSSYWKDWKQLSEEEIDSWYKKYANEKLRDNIYGNLETYDEWEKSGTLERFIRYYTSPSGDEIVAFGKYGYDG